MVVVGQQVYVSGADRNGGGEESQTKNFFWVTESLHMLMGYTKCWQACKYGGNGKERDI